MNKADYTLKLIEMLARNILENKRDSASDRDLLIIAETAKQLRS